MPQSVRAEGFRARGRDEAEAELLRQDALAVAAAGAFAVVIEGTREPLAREIATTLGIPSIGIGASPACDGQVLVAEDLLGLFATFTPRFVKRYAELGAAVSAAVATYADEVRKGTFPGPAQCYRG
jgi:3-methyl-2-oxobutanoate hydroxymethyltransferase